MILSIPHCFDLESDSFIAAVLASKANLAIDEGGRKEGIGFERSILTVGSEKNGAREVGSFVSWDRRDFNMSSQDLVTS